jgi:hypothetical protein
MRTTITSAALVLVAALVAAEPLVVEGTWGRITCDSKVISSNDVYTEVSWYAELTNRTGSPYRGPVGIRWLDAEDFKIADAVELVELADGETQRVDDVALIENNKWAQIAKFGCSTGQ